MSEDTNVCSPWGYKGSERPLDAVVAELAERQHGVVTVRQLQALGLERSGVARRARAGRLHRMHRGVYAVGRPGLTKDGWRMAAVLAFSGGAFLSRRSAAGLWALRPDNRPRIEVVVPGTRVRPRAGIAAHASAILTAADTTVHRSIPVTTVARTLVDLGNVTTRREVELAVEQAEVLRLFDLRAVEGVLARTGPTRGRALLSSVLRTLSPTTTLTASGLEEAFLEIVREAGLPDPEVNAPMTLPDGTPIKVDFLWRSRRLAVETDSLTYHRTTRSRERDTRRDQLLRLAGYDPLRFTDTQVAHERDWVRDTLTALASRADGDRSGRAGTQAA